MGGGDGADEAWKDVEAAWQEAGLVELPMGERPDPFMGVSALSIGEHTRGGGPGDVNALAHVFLTLWPYAAAGAGGAVGADAWATVKKGLALAIRRILQRDAASVTVEVVADQEDYRRDVTFEFQRADLAFLDAAVDALAVRALHAREGDVVAISRSSALRWNAEQQQWQVTETDYTTRSESE
jgi:hypothetical protein